MIDLRNALFCCASWLTGSSTARVLWRWPVSRSERIKPISCFKARHKRRQERLALLKMLALGDRQIEAGRVQPAAEVVARLRERRRAD